MRVENPKPIAALPSLGVELRPRVSLTEMTSLGIGGNSDLLRIRDYRHLPELIGMLREAGVPHRLSSRMRGRPLRLLTLFMFWRGGKW